MDSNVPLAVPAKLRSVQGSGPDNARSLGVASDCIGATDKRRINANKLVSGRRAGTEAWEGADAESPALTGACQRRASFTCCLTHIYSHSIDTR